MKIKEAEERTGLTRKAIRYYEENGLIHPTQKENGYKDYDSATIQRLLIIKKLRLLDFSVTEVRLYLSGGAPSSILEEKIQCKQKELSRTRQSLRLLQKLKNGADLAHLDVEGPLLGDTLDRTQRILSGNLLFALANLCSFLVITGILIFQAAHSPAFTLPPPVLFLQCFLTVVLGLWKTRLKSKALERGVFLRMIMPAEAAMMFLLCAFTFAVAGQMVLSRIWLIHRALAQMDGSPSMTAVILLQGLCLLLYAALDLTMVVLPFTSAMRTQAELTTGRQPTSRQPRLQDRTQR